MITTEELGRPMIRIARAGGRVLENRATCAQLQVKVVRVYEPAKSKDNHYRKFLTPRLVRFINKSQKLDS